MAVRFSHPKTSLIHLNTTPIGVLPSHIEEELVDACWSPRNKQSSRNHQNLCERDVFFQKFPWMEFLPGLQTQIKTQFHPNSSPPVVPFNSDSASATSHSLYLAPPGCQSIIGLWHFAWGILVKKCKEPVICHWHLGLGVGSQHSLLSHEIWSPFKGHSKTRAMGQH